MKKQKVKFTIKGIEQELLNGKGEFEKLAEGGKKEIEKAFAKIETSDLSTEDLIRKGLAVLGK